MSTGWFFLLALVCFGEDAEAFCGFYASSTSADAINNSSEVVLMRDGTSTSLSMRNDYEGPVEDFALVVPVPQLLRREDVKTLPHAIFDKIERITSPRMVNYWEADPCTWRGGKETVVLSSSNEIRFTGVEALATFAVGEYDITMLSAKDSVNLEKWLLGNGYKIPKGASAALAPYIARGMYFMVAKVDPKRVTFVDGRANLSPLRMQYTSTEFSLPVRLGLLNARGPQNLIVYLLTKDGRNEAANYPGAVIPTNLIITDEEARDLDAFYEELFAYVTEAIPEAFVTEYSWRTDQKCDPCVGPLGMDTLVLPSDLLTLGADHPQVARRTYDASIDKARALSGDTARASTRGHHRGVKSIARCYHEAYPSSDIKTRELTARFDIAPSGKVLSTRERFDRKPTGQLRACVREVLTGFRFRATPKRSLIEFTILIGSSVVVSRGFTLTRLRKRFDVESSRDDIVFKKSAYHLEGGVGTVRDEMLPRTSLGTRAAIGFQARYARLIRWPKEPTCEVPNPTSWYGQPRPIEASVSTTPYELTDAIKRQLRDDAIVAPTPLSK